MLQDRAFVCFLEALSPHNIYADFSSPSLSLCLSIFFSVAFCTLNDKLRAKALGKMRKNVGRRQLDDDDDDDDD